MEIERLKALKEEEAREVRKHEATTVTNYFTGMFKESHNLQNRFLQYIGQK